MRSAVWTFGALVIAALARSASAQTVSMAATATVAPSLSATSVRHLDFGSVYAGVTKSIAYDATTSGRVLLNGLVGAEVSFAFTLPDALTAGDKTLPIGAWTGCYGTTDVATACTTFTPSLSAATARLNAADGSLHLFIGATVSPSTVQLQGHTPRASR